MPTISKNDDIDDENSVDYNDIYNDTVYIISGSKSEIEYENELEKENENANEYKDAVINSQPKPTPIYDQFVYYVKNRVPTSLDKFKPSLFYNNLTFFKPNARKPSVEIESVEFNNHDIVDNPPNSTSSNSSIEYVIQNINTAYSYVLDKYDDTNLSIFNTSDTDTKTEYILDCEKNEIIEHNPPTPIPNSVAMECVIQNVNTVYAYVLDKYDGFTEK